MNKEGLFAYETMEYYPEISRTSLSDAEMSKEYSRLRAVAVKRLKALGNSEYSESSIYLDYRKAFPPLSDVGAEELPYRLYTLSRFLRMEKSTVSGARLIERRTLKTLHKHGYSFVDEGNIQDFGRFMESFRAKNLRSVMSSSQAADFFGERNGHVKPDELEKEFSEYVEERAAIIARIDEIFR